ncbi:exodeoxyribonuclease V subunit gamma [Robbsia sp. Bb-Pol-6]|uniref:RecBCD enzyme subunit RecC n=1 Tax=Robbsia betulipollinis TaxID=2981849 RepID=A0ABT3ZME2_9BURK|nr:exodeoxyribonuclease V subunit gamma [Robbsia betulipollinis]MCY0387110.1 exodeoxyribonuclease V subunit gamma [Robbsia betulipollinis]
MSNDARRDPNPSTNDLSPGFMVVHGNQPDALRALLVSWMHRYPLAPLENEVVLVQSNGIAQWLKLALARDADAGGCGIAAALDAQLPQRFIWQAYRAVLGEAAVPLTSAFDKSLLIWRLMRLLPSLSGEPVFAPLRRFLQRDTDCRRRYQLAERLADLFDQYQVYRADWLAGWARGEDDIVTSRQGRQPIPDTLLWQPRLWRALREDVGAEQAGTSRAEVHQRFLDVAGGRAHAARPPGLPRRLLVFGISSLPQQALEVLSGLANWMQVLMCVHNPCEHYWANIIADKDLLRGARLRQSRKQGMPEQIDETQLHLYAHPLLAAWGKQGRDYIGLLDAHDERERYEQRFIEISQRIDLFESNGDATLLQQLQDDILALRPLGETRALWPAVDPAVDHSIRFHVAHSPQREVEVLHDQLLAAFGADPTLRPRDVIVMVPDINAYAPHIQAVFGLFDTRDRRTLPFRIADQGQRHHDPLVGALEKLLGLPQSRLAVSDVLDLLEVPALRRRFGIEEADLPLLHRWISAANIRWGLHAEQRHSLDLPDALEQNSWFFGVRRMLLGYAVGAGDAWRAIEPLDEIGGLDAVLLGPLVHLLDTLDAQWRQLRTPATPAEWYARLHGLLDAFFLADDGDDGFTLLRLDGALQDWLDACVAGGLAETLPLSVVREHWLQQIDETGLSQPFFAGAVTFATLMPMRAIPFRHLCLLGMNDGDYPRSRVAMDFDLMSRDYRPGDRSRREDDRYLFLEALLSARDHLHISWVGNSIHDNTERPPSVLVAQLRDHLAAGWRLARGSGDDGGEDGGGEDDGSEGGGEASSGGEAPRAPEAATGLLDALTLTHRLQPFNRDYFSDAADPRLFSFAREWRDGLAAQEADGGAANEQDARDGAARERHVGPLPAFDWNGTVTLRQLADFVKDPVRAFFRLRLNVAFETVDPVSEDQEPFALDALENWQLQDELIQAQLSAVEDDASRGAALAAQLERIGRRGELPAAHFAGAVGARLVEPMDKLFNEYRDALANWPDLAPDEPVEYVEPGVTPEAAPGTGDGAGTGGITPLHLSDWLGGWRRNAAGERGRVLLESSGLVRKGAYRRDRLIPFWITHVAGHLCGEALTTVIVSKAGTVTLPRLTQQQVRSYWDALLAAWRAGMTRPLPLALRTGFAWLEKGGTAHVAGAAADIDGTAVHGAAREAARDCYEMNDPDYGRFGERDSNPYLLRAYPSFDALWSDGEFATLAEALLRPVFDHVGARAAARQHASTAPRTDTDA